MLKIILLVAVALVAWVWLKGWHRIARLDGPVANDGGRMPGVRPLSAEQAQEVRK